MKWVIAMNKANYSKQQITEALIDLLQKTSIEDITITSLVTKAHVSRNAFYNNYQSVEDVLKEAYRQAHQKAFQNKYIDISYFTSDEAILDLYNSLIKILPFYWHYKSGIYFPISQNIILIVS